MDPGRLRVVLASPRNPLNIGAAARAMSNFGFSDLAVVNAYDVAFREARSAVGAAPLLAAARDCTTIPEALAECHVVVGTTSLGHRSLQHPLRRLEYGAKLIREALENGPVALLFGSEKFGLSNDELSYCHWLMRIPSREEHGSMNLGQAVALCLYELIRNPDAETSEPRPRLPAAGEKVERMSSMLLEALELSGYVNPRTSETTEQKIRRLVRRMNLNSRDIEVWLGILRQILWKLK